MDVAQTECDAMSSSVKCAPASAASAAAAIVKRMFTTMRGRIAYHPDQILATRHSLPVAEDLVGMSQSDFATYISSKFEEGMTLFNWGQGPGTWQIDHIMALSLFDVRDVQQMLRVSHYSNLQPMWSQQNMDKYNHLPDRLDGIHMLQLAYGDQPGNLTHLVTQDVAQLPGQVLPVHDAWTQLRIAYAFFDRKTYAETDEKDVLHITSEGVEFESSNQLDAKEVKKEEEEEQDVIYVSSQDIPMQVLASPRVTRKRKRRRKVASKSVVDGCTVEIV